MWRSNCCSEEPHDHLAQVLAPEQADECVGRAFDPFDHRFSVAQLPLPYPAAHLLGKISEAVEVITHDEAAQGEPPAHGQGDVSRARWRLSDVVKRDGAAHGDPAEATQREQGRLEVIAPDVVEVNIDALRRSRGQQLPDLAVAVVKTG